MSDNLLVCGSAKIQLGAWKTRFNLCALSKHIIHVGIDWQSVWTGVGWGGGGVECTGGGVGWGVVGCTSGGVLSSTPWGLNNI